MRFSVLIILKYKEKWNAYEVRCNVCNRHALREKSPLRSSVLRFPVILSVAFSFSHFFFLSAVKVIHVIALFCIEATTTSSFHHEYRKVHVDLRKYYAGNTGNTGGDALKSFREIDARTTHLHMCTHIIAHIYLFLSLAVER